MANENNSVTLPFNPRHVSTILDEILEKAKNIEKESTNNYSLVSNSPNYYNISAIH